MKGENCSQCLMQVEDDESEDDVDIMMDKIGLTVSDGDGSAVKLSKFLSLKARKGSQGRSSTREEHKLKKLTWDINDDVGVEGGGEKMKRSARGSLKVYP